LSIFDGLFNNGAEIFVPGFGPGISGIDPELCQRFGHIGIFGEKQVAVVMKISDHRNRYSPVDQFFLIYGTAFGRLIVIYSDPYQFRPRLVKMVDLVNRFINISCIGVGHRLNHNRIIAADVTPPTSTGIDFLR
jgi:hypothetical protein